MTLDPPSFHFPGSDKLPDALRAADAVGVFYQLGPSLQHAGILYVDGAELLRAIHLASHSWLVRELSEKLLGRSKTSAVAVHMPPERATFLAALCDRIHAKFSLSRTLPYGMKWSGGGFKPDGSVDMAPGQVGFTCTTFVLAVFDCAGVPLVQPETWKHRPEDDGRHTDLVELLRSQKVDPLHIAKVAEEKTCARFRPEEAANAGLFAMSARPVALGDVEATAADMKASIARTLKWAAASAA